MSHTEIQNIPLCSGCHKTFSSTNNLRKHESTCGIYIAEKKVAQHKGEMDALRTQNRELQQNNVWMLSQGQDLTVKYQQLETENNVLREQLALLRDEGQQVIDKLVNDGRRKDAMIQSMSTNKRLRLEG